MLAVLGRNRPGSRLHVGGFTIRRSRHLGAAAPLDTPASLARARFGLLGDGGGVHWSDADEDISVARLFVEAPPSGSVPGTVPSRDEFQDHEHDHAGQL